MLDLGLSQKSLEKPIDGVFIVGYWNSGTTMLADLLDRHPRLSLRRARWKKNNLEENITKRFLRSLGYDYPVFTHAYYKQILKHGYHKSDELTLNAGEIKNFRKKFKRNFFVLPKNKVLIKNTFMFLVKRFLDETFEHDRIKKIIILRNIFSQSVSRDNWRNGDPEENLIDRCRFWNRNMEYFFKHWHNDPETFIFRYENFCQKPEEHLQKLCRFLDVDSSPLQNRAPQVENRMERWFNLDQKYKDIVIKETTTMQKKMDFYYPLISESDNPQNLEKIN